MAFLDSTRDNGNPPNGRCHLDPVKVKGVRGKQELGSDKVEEEKWWDSRGFLPPALTHKALRGPKSQLCPLHHIVRYRLICVL